MKKYEPGEIATYYLIIIEDGWGSRIQAWSDNKDLVKSYFEFHNCPKFIFKKIEKPIEDMKKLLDDENQNDEIILTNLVTRDSKKDKVKMIYVPLTRSEIRFLNEEMNNFAASFIDYSLLNQAIPFLKSKYQKALKTLYLDSIITSTIYGRSNKLNSNMELDQVGMLIRLFPEYFG